jgi:hypothetical protein
MLSRLESFDFVLKWAFQLGLVAPSYNTNTSYNTSTWETGAGGSRVQGQPGFSPPDYRLASVILASQEQRSGGLWFKASLGKQFESVSKTPSIQKGWQSGSSDRVQAWGSEFKPQASLGYRVRPYLKKKKKKKRKMEPGMVVRIHVIPAMRKAEVGRSQFKAFPWQKQDYLKNKLKWKGLRVWLKYLQGPEFKS